MVVVRVQQLVLDIVSGLGEQFENLPDRRRVEEKDGVIRTMRLIVRPGSGGFVIMAA